MRLLLHRPLHKLSALSSTTSRLMASKQLLKSTPFTNPSPLSSQAHTFHSQRLGFLAFPTKPTSKARPFCLRTNGYSYVSTVEAPKPIELEITDEMRRESLLKKLKEISIDDELCIPMQYGHLICPMCKGGDSEEKSLALFVEQDWSYATWQCHRRKCDWKGRTMALAGSKSSYTKIKNSRTDKTKRDITLESLGLEPLCEEVLAFFSERGISRETVIRNKVMQKRCSITDQISIAFTYWRNGKLISCKYRDINKKFWQEKDTERIFYGLDDIKDTNDIIIVEGEMDKLAMEESGYRNCVSVPDGAPAKASPSDKDLPPEEQDTKYQFLWNCKEYLKKESRIILATDEDGPGQALAEELARRLGRERCWRVSWPKRSNQVEHFKDANEVLMYLGPAELKEVIENAELYPIRGLFRFQDYFDEINAYYYRTYEHDCGVKTGWRDLDELYNVVPGELTIVTGVPNSGKSEWIDALLCNLYESHDWKFALCSMENKVREHARKLLEKHIRKPFFDGRYAGPAERMSVEEFEQGKQWLNDTFHLIRCEDDSLPNIKWVLDLARSAVLRHGVRGLVIDPYNELDHQRPPNQTETEYVSQMLTNVKRFAQHHACHVWFVAHPRQLHQWVGGPPNLYDISGSAHFINKCDNGLVIHRNRDPDAGELDKVQVCVRKVRNKVAGTIGDAYLTYDRATGRYVDIPKENEKK
ncbi:twinkle homolog protein, chloroplastic/mitochondrial [Argentina anserina]|uniref:twinkle homolog protein, chloroplastic/mitochondrial n=1 Tax=Argentina anserina TaxID=57926 RepID=UPI0021766A5A|nr:twinkle homolog protein, chloroplastic/mitochondrial [Potentilla anserina]